MKTSIRSGNFLWLGLVAAGVVLTGCSEGAGSREDMVEVLARNDSFTQVEAECITDAVFGEYAEDDDALKKISAQTYEQLQGEDGLPGFSEFLDGAVSDCTTVGPSTDG